MRLDGGGVDENLRRRTADLRERLEQRRPYALFGPAHIAIVEGFLRPVLRRRIDPAPARFQHVNDAADDASVINAGLAPRISGKMRLDLRKLCVRQPELIPMAAPSRKP